MDYKHLYDVIVLRGQVYEAIVKDLNEIRTYLKDLIVEHNDQCALIANINELVTQGNPLSAQRMLNSMQRKFTDIPYVDWHQMIQNSMQLIKEAENLLKDVGDSHSMIGRVMTLGTGKQRLKERYARIQSEMEVLLPECEIKSEAQRILAKVKL